MIGLDFLIHNQSIFPPTGIEWEYIYLRVYILCVYTIYIYMCVSICMNNFGLNKLTHPSTDWLGLTA